MRIVFVKTGASLSVLCFSTYVFSKKQAQTCTENGNGAHAQYCKVPKELRDDRADADSMLLQAAFLIAAGFSHTALRRPCANAACQLPQQRAAVCAAAAAENNDERARLESLWALPSENKYESDVWAANDVMLGMEGPTYLNDTVAVKKHTKGSLLGPSRNKPAERLVVSWEHRVDGEAGNIDMCPSSLTSQEPPLPGGFTRGDVWATTDIEVEDQDIVAVKKHTKGSLLGPSVNAPAERLSVVWEHRADGEPGYINMYPGSLTSREPPLPGGFIRGDVWATSDLLLFCV